MANLLISPQAEQDLEEIFYHTFITWGTDQAEKYQDELYFAMQLILKNNTLGEVYP